MFENKKMKKIINIFLFIFLTSCTSMSQFGAGVDITFDPRTIGMQIDDAIMQKSLATRLTLKDKKYFLSIQSSKETETFFYQEKSMSQRKR